MSTTILIGYSISRIKAVQKATKSKTVHRYIQISLVLRLIQFSFGLFQTQMRETSEPELIFWS